MAKETINVGTVVDDGTGDYLRKGGIKTNSNFDEIYNKLGDESSIHASGAWQVYKPTVGSNDLQLQFGDSIAIDTSLSSCDVYLPSALVADVGKTIRIRDSFKTWGTTLNINGVTVHPNAQIPITSNKIKQSAIPKIFNDVYRDLEFVYTVNNDWEYVESKYIDRISNASRSAENSVEFLADASAPGGLGLYSWDLQSYEGFIYNPETVKVFRKGNLLSKNVDAEGKPTELSDYGSIPNHDSGSPDYNPEIINGLAKLDGKTIRLTIPAKDLDPIVISSLLENPDTYTTTFKQRTVIIKDVNADSEYDPQCILEVDTAVDISIKINDMGYGAFATLNPLSAVVKINGKSLINAAHVIWVEDTGNPIQKKPFDFSVSRHIVDEDPSGQLYYNQIDFVDTGYLADGDVLSVEWYVNNIGADLPWDGNGGIEQRVSDRFLRSDTNMQLTSQMSYSDTTRPGLDTAQIDTTIVSKQINNVHHFFDLIYPVGTIYENAHNPHNPATYMGMGEWELFSQGQVTVGWSSDVNNIFNKNSTTDPDSAALQSAGGEFGSAAVMINDTNIPQLQTDDEVLMRPLPGDDQGDITINNGCLLDPTADEDIQTFISKKAIIRDSGSNQQDTITNIQPSLTVYKWIRVQ